jgi:hypothetical protein
MLELHRRGCNHDPHHNFHLDVARNDSKDGTVSGTKSKAGTLTKPGYDPPLRIRSPLLRPPRPGLTATSLTTTAKTVSATKPKVGAVKKPVLVTGGAGVGVERQGRRKSVSHSLSRLDCGPQFVYNWIMD